jgi:hypothetical protein
MKDGIAFGFHGCIDFECIWDEGRLQALTDAFHVSLADLGGDESVDSERDILLAVLWHMKQGVGGEFVPSSSADVLAFAKRFDYRVTIGGTAARAAIAARKIGYGSALQSCCNNILFERLLPGDIHFISSVAEQDGEIYPHVSLQYPAGCRIRLADGSFTTVRPNRVLFSRDPDSMAMRITDRFHPMISDAKVMLLSCFSEVQDEALLKSRLQDTIDTIQHLAPAHFVIMEDGCYSVKHFRTLVRQTLALYLDALSMNEDEFFELLGRELDLLDPVQAEAAIREVYERIRIPNLIIHTAYWALAWGRDAKRLQKSVTYGVWMASTRFRLGDDFGLSDFTDTGTLADHPEGRAFCERLRQSAGDLMYCVPGKQLGHIAAPTTVGLGDFFAGGLAAGMADTCPITD